MLGVSEEGLEELRGVGAGHGLMVGLVVLGLGVLDEGQPLPIGHQPFHEVVGFFVVGGRKLRGVRRIEIGEVGLGLRQEIVDVLAGCLALLAVVENEGVDAGHVLAQPLLEFLRGVLALAVAGRRREMPEAALAGHAGLAQGEESDVFLETREFVDVRPDRVDQAVDALGEEDALEVVPDEGSGLRVVREQRLQVLIGETHLVVLDDRPGRVVAVAQPVVGQDPQALGLVHVGHDSRAGKRVDDGFHAVRGVLPNPIHQLLLRADVVGDVLGPLFRRRLLGSRLGLGLERFEVQVKGGVRFEEERQPVTVGCEKLHSVLRSCRDKSG